LSILLITNFTIKTYKIMVKAKYQDVLSLGEALNIQNGNVTEENGVLKIKGTANTLYDKDVL